MIGFRTLKLTTLFIFVMIETSVFAQWKQGDRSRATSAFRAYPGGVDEEDLQVQTELSEPPIKVTEQMLQNQVLSAQGGKLQSSDDSIETND